MTMIFEDGIDVGCTQEFGQITIGGVVMHRPAFAITNPEVLMVGPDQRGDDLVIPGRPYALAEPRRGDVTKATFRLLIDSRFTPSGPLNPGSHAAGLDVIMAYLRTYVTNPTYIGDGTRLLSYVGPGGSSGSAGCHVSPLRLGGSGGPIMRATLEVSFPDGHPLD